jgi:hypothetical protein
MNTTPVTISNLTDALAPLWIALHENGLIHLSELALFYEDALARRRFGRGESADETAFAQDLVVGLNRLAAGFQAHPPAPTGASDTQPPE